MIDFDLESIIDYDVDFYQQYPGYVGIFTAPSEYMWSLVYLYHPKSPLRELPFKRKIEEINRIAPTTFDVDEYPEEGKRFQEYNTSFAQRSIQRWRKKLEERDDFMDSVPYSEDTVSMNESLLKNHKTIWDGYMQAEALLTKEDSSRISGDQEESAVERGLI